MNILIIRETNPYAISNATNNRFLSLIDGLVKFGCNINILILNGYYNKKEKKDFKKSGTYKGINYSYLIPVNFENIFIRLFFYDIIPSQLLAKLITFNIKKNSYDFIWIDFSQKTVEVGLDLLKKEFRIPFIHERGEFSWIGFRNKKLHKKYLEIFLNKIDILFVMTKTLMNYYSNYIDKKTNLFHLPMTVDFDRFSIRNQNNKLKKPYIGYCGSMSNKKDGVTILILSFIQIMNKNKDLHLYLAGPLTPNKDYKNQIKIIKENNALNRITYLGNLSAEQIVIFLKNANILALARPDSKQAEGGFPTKLGEYLASGNPVCVTRVGEIEHYLIDNYSAFIAEPNSISAFVNTLERALNTTNALVIGLNGQNVALQHFNKDKQSKIFFEKLANYKML